MTRDILLHSKMAEQGPSQASVMEQVLDSVSDAGSSHVERLTSSVYACPLGGRS